MATSFLRKLMWSGVSTVLVAALASHVAATKVAAIPQPQAPQTLQETGLYADPAALQIDPRHLAFAPQYPLWSDGAAKRRWISLPPGTAIDASDPEAWVFPVGSRLWKEFSFAGRRVETRYLERQAEGWRYAAYAWSPDGREAVLVSARGRRNAFPLEGGRSHTIPAVGDCKVCHQGGRGEVLGFSALQLSPDRDPGAPHAEPSDIDLDDLIEKGLLINLPPRHRRRIAAASPTERAALGYLHGNCGHCHNADGPLRNLGLVLRHAPEADPPLARTTTVGAPLRKPVPGTDADLRVAPRSEARSALLQRIASRTAAQQMPPLGTELVDHDAVALIRRWIAETDALTTAASSKETP